MIIMTIIIILIIINLYSHVSKSVTYHEDIKVQTERGFGKQV